MTNNPLREMIVTEARKHVLRVSDRPAMLVNGKRRGADLLRKIIDEACERPRRGGKWLAAHTGPK